MPRESAPSLSKVASTSISAASRPNCLDARSVMALRVVMCGSRYPACSASHRLVPLRSLDEEVGLPCCQEHDGAKRIGHSKLDRPSMYRLRGRSRTSDN